MDIKKSALASSLVLSAGAAMAQADAGVAAINDLSSTATTYITAALSVAVLIAGGFWGIRMMKKAFSKAG